MPSPTLIVPLPVNKFLSKVAPNVPNNIQRNHSFCYFASLTVLLMSFINKPDSSSDLITFMISLISLFAIISLVIPDPKIYFY